MENIDVQSLEFAQTLKTEEDFQNFVDSHPEIERSIDLRKKYYHIDRRFYNLKRDGKLNKDFSIKYKVTSFIWSDYNTKEDIQRFIDENNIESASIFNKQYGGLARKASRLKIKMGEFRYHPKLIDVANKFIKENNITSFEDLESNFPEKAVEFSPIKDDIDYHNPKTKIICPRWSDYNTKEDIQRFIDDNEIESSTAFNKRYGGLSRRVSRLGISHNDLIYYNRQLVDTANKFMEENHILSLKDLSNKFPDKVEEFLSVKHCIRYYHPPIINPWANYNTVKEIQEFINTNDIKSRKEFSKKYSGLYNKSSKIGVLSSLVFEEDRPIIKYSIKERFKTVEDVNEYLKKNNITKYSQLVSTKEGKAIYAFTRSMKWNLEFSYKPADYSNYNTKEDFQNFIDINNIKSPGEFKKINNGIYSRMNRLRLHKQVKYPEPARRSLLEILVAKGLDEIKLEYQEQETFPGLKDKASLKVDFLIESKKLILEPGGIQHLVPCGFINEEKFKILQKHDKMKRDYFISKGYTILYLFKNDHPNLVSNEEFNKLVSEYPGECYVIDDIDKFFSRIKSI